MCGGSLCFSIGPSRTGVCEAADPPREQATPIRIEQILYAQFSAFEGRKDRTVKPFAITGIRWDPAESAQFRVANPFIGMTAFRRRSRGRTWKGEPDPRR